MALAQPQDDAIRLIMLRVRKNSQSQRIVTKAVALAAVARDWSGACIARRAPAR
jgi:hypothetical protein